MSKQGMKRPSRTHTKPRNDEKPVPEIQGDGKHVKNIKSAARMEPTAGISHSDLTADNMQNDLPAADLQDL